MPFLSLLAAAVSALGLFIVDLCGCTVLLYEAIWKDRAEPWRACRALRIGGRCMLITALMICATRWGWDLGLLIWVGLLIGVTIAVLFLLPRLSRRWLALAPHSMVLGFTMLVRALS